MVKLQIPDKYKLGLKKLTDFDDSAFKEFQSALGEKHAALKAKDLASAISVSGVSSKDIEEVIDTLLSLYGLRDFLDDSTEEVVEKICQGIEIENFHSNEQILKSRLTSLLELDGVLTIASRANSVMHDHERLFSSSRVLTDIRPVFETEIEKGPAGVAVTHMLKIKYLDSIGTHEFFVALDSNDLKQIREQLVRAEEKSKAIKLMLNEVSVPCLDY
jgi:hypothetical protein